MWMMDTSCVERGYATMNRVHSAERNGLSVSHANDIMTCISVGPSVRDFDPKVVLEMWLNGPRGEASARGRYLKGKLNDAFRDC